MATIQIDRLGPIRNFEMDIHKINLLIGEQATGKSTICKAIYFFRLVKEEIVEYLYRLSTVGRGLDRSSFPRALNFRVKDLCIQLFGYSWDLPNDLNAKYSFHEDVWISIHINEQVVGGRTKKYFDVEYSEALTREVKRLEKEALQFFGQQTDEFSYSYLTAERNKLHEDIRKNIDKLFEDDCTTYYIPAGRSMLTLMSGQKTNLDYTALDLVNRKFMQFIENIQQKFDRGITRVHDYYPRNERKFDVNQIAKELLEDLKGDYYHTQYREFLKVDDNNIPINFISSGQQEVLWLLNQLYILLLRDEKAFVVIEEPEAHLYPKLQKKVIDFIIYFSNITGSTVVITTHSPYILTSANINCYAGSLIASGAGQAHVEHIVGKHKAVIPGELYAGKLVNDGIQTQVESLVMPDSGELYAELIDEISDSNSEIYTALYDLEENNAHS